MTVWPIWIPLAIYIMIIIHIFRNYRYSYITIDDEGITYKVFMGRKKYISYMNIAEYNLKPYQDRFILRSSTGKKSRGTSCWNFFATAPVLCFFSCH